MANTINPDNVLKLWKDTETRCQTERYSYERDWFRNVLYFLGIQWITYSPGNRKWKPRKIQKWVPRPVTNKFAPVAMSMIQVLSQKDLVVRATSATDNPDDIAAAAVADRNFDVILKEAGAKEARKLASAWMTLTGSSLLHPNYDNDPMAGKEFIQHLQCQQCQQTFAPDMAGNAPEGQEQGNVCPKCGSPNVIEAPEGVGEFLPTGKLDVEVFSPFEAFMNLQGKAWKDVNTVLARRSYDLDTIKRKYNRPDLEPDKMSNTGGAIGLNLLSAIAYAAGNATYGTGLAAGRSTGDDSTITIDHLWVRPCSDYPEGLAAVISNSQIINEDQLKEGIPYRDKKGNPRFTWHLAKFDHVPGRTFGRTPLDDVAPKQEQRNKIEALIQLIITRCANPVWLIAKNTGVTQITGEPGQVIEGNWMMNPLLRPERVEGAGVPTSVIAWLEKIDSDIEEVAGIFEVLKGNAPSGVTAGTALRLLLERAYTRFTPVSVAYEEVWQNVAQDLLCMFQQFGYKERINRIQGPGNTWEIQKFNKADVDGAIDVIVETGSTLPKSTVGEQALIQDLIGMQVINPLLPETQYKILQKFGSTDLLGDADLNIRSAQRENWDFIHEGIEPEIDLIIDLHPAHIQVHKQLALTSDYRTWPKEKKQVLVLHIIDHMLAMAPAIQGEAGAGENAGKEGKGKSSGSPKQSEETRMDNTQAEPAGGMIM